jgi:hypothetical protein
VQVTVPAAAVRRRLSWLAIAVATLVVLLALPAFAADPKTEKDAQALQKKAIDEDFLNVNYAGAIKKLTTAVTKCGGDKCNSSLKASLHRDLGAMQVLNGSVDEGKSNFAQAIGFDSNIALDPSYKNPQLEGIWNEVKKKGGAGAGAPPGGGKPVTQPSGGDFVHTPPPEALVRTPLAVYAEYQGSEELSRVIAKYKGFGMTDWKTVSLKQAEGGGGYGGLIACKDVALGPMQYFLQGFNAQNDPVAASGSRNKPYTVPVKSQIAGEPPSLPGEEPPAQCAESGECPPGLSGPGCGEGSSKKGGGEDCEKDKDCASGSCVADKCAEKKAGGEACEKDDECNSGACSSGKCTGKKGEGEDCEADEDCDSGKCKADKCVGSGGGKPSKIWVGLSIAADVDFLSGGADVCKLNKAGTGGYGSSGYSCVDSGGNNFPANAVLNDQIIPGVKDTVTGGAKLGNFRILLSLDYALNSNVLLGARAGYVLGTDPAKNAPKAAFAPVHIEGRVTYVFGKNALTTKGVSPMVLAGLGIGEFDAYVPVFVVPCALMPGTTTCASPLSAQSKSAQENAWITAGPVFIDGGAGARILLGPKFALTGALKLQFAFGGGAGLLPGVAPEVGMQFGL